MTQYLNYIDVSDIQSYKNKRDNERHVADDVFLPDPAKTIKENLTSAKANGVKFVIVGIPEDIGPRANCGKGGCKHGWQQFLPVFFNQQSNQFFDWSQVMLLGSVEVDDLQKQSNHAVISDHKLVSLRELVGRLDERVTEVLTPIFAEGFHVIVIGGGHNNAYPIIKSVNSALNQKVSCVNLDPHADFRDMEGRHSGNPFRYAHAHGFLEKYCVVGLHEQKNNQSTIEALMAAHFPFYTFQQLFVRNTISFEDALEEAYAYIAMEPVSGIEIDVDSVKHMPSSAYSVTGFSSEQAMRFVSRLADNKNCKYLHLCEAAPDDNEPPGHKSLESSQLLTQLLYSYVCSRQGEP